MAELMGHSSTRTTMDVYFRVSDPDERDAVERIAANLAGAPPAIER